MVLAPKKAKTPAAHHLKRTGDHHKRSKPYHKTYWPYLPLLAIAGFAMLLNMTWGNLNLHGSQVLGTSTGLTSQQLLDDTNKDRAGLGIDTLNIDNRLSAAAQAKAQDMASHNYWSHVSPDGKQPWTFAQKAGYDYRSLGENLAYGFSSPDDVVDGWMHSPEHRTNMLDPAYRNVGFGIVRAADYQGKGPQTIIVAMYGMPAADFAVSATVNNPTVLPAKTVARSDKLAYAGLPWINLALIAVITLGAAAFIFRHAKALHRVFAYSEEFIVHHPHLDILIIGGVALAILLTRTTGFIH